MNDMKNVNDVNNMKKKICSKCGSYYEELLYEPFCCWGCKSECYKEMARDIDGVMGVFKG